MDYPKSVPGVGLVDGRFVDEDAAAGRVGSLIPAAWGCAVTDELLAVVRAAGLDPTEADNAQAIKAINILIERALSDLPRAYSINALPQVNKGPILVIECSEVWTWVAGQFFTGYRSPLCGRPMDGHTALPLASEVDAIGGLVSKVDYARLWGYAQEQGLVKSEAVWLANRGTHWFSDYSATQFRVPDLRDMFRRFAGSDADTANARALASRQAHALMDHAHNVLAYPQLDGAGGALSRNADGKGTMPSGGIVSGGGFTETRPVNTAYHARIHA